MTLQQLTCLISIVECGLSVSKAAVAMHTSQPGVSRHIGLLERELGVMIFVRERRRLVQLTPQGKDLVAIARQAVQSIGDLKTLALGFKSGDAGKLTIATAQPLARYRLPGVVARFAREYPKVQLHFRLGYSAQLVDWVAEGEADLCICVSPEAPNRDVVLLPGERLDHVLLAQPEHPLLQKRRRLRLEDIAEYPLISFEDSAAAQRPMRRAFAARGITPNVVLTASDADVIKTYVKAGLGIAILTNTTFHPREDKTLRAIDVRHLVESSSLYVGLRRHSYVPRYLARFVELSWPKFTAARLASVVNRPL
jgi:LysR family cys regulon transcriptional activator